MIRDAFQSTRRQAGVSLIELMIAMAIGLFLLLGLTTIFMSNKQSFLIMQRQGDLQENMRLTALLLTQSIQKAGYHVDPSDGPALLFPDGQEAIVGMDTGSSPPQITFRFESEGGAVDCLGDTIGSLGNPAMATSQYYLDNDNEFSCRTRDYPDTASEPSGWEDDQPLISNVEDLAIRYGVDSDADGSVDQYVAADLVSFWDNVISIRLALLMVSDGAIKPVARQETFDLLGNPVTSPNDRLAREVLELTIALPNRLHRVPASSF